MTYMLVPAVEKTYEWDQAKSERNQLERHLPFELAVILFDCPTLERPDSRLDYREQRTQAIGVIGSLVLACIYTDRGLVRRIISLRPANRRERDVYRAAFQD
jgi:uncharacterized protein